MDKLQGAIAHLHLRVSSNSSLREVRVRGAGGWDVAAQGQQRGHRQRAVASEKGRGELSAERLPGIRAAR